MNPAPSSPAPQALYYAHLTSRAVVAVGGADWRGFLQGLLSQDVETLAPGQARFAGLLSPQGRLLHDLMVVGGEDGCRLEVEAQAREALIARLNLYRLRAKVTIAADPAPVGALWERPETDAGPDAGAGWITDPRLAALGLRGWGEAPPPQALVTDEAAYDRARLNLGVPGPADWGHDQTYPIEADFDLLNGIDFKKGCFIGQETTSRMKRRGAIKSRMLPIVFDGPPPPPGSEVLAGDLRAGQVLSGVQGRAMALLRLDRIAGAELTAGGRPVRADPPAWFPEG